MDKNLESYKVDYKKTEEVYRDKLVEAVKSALAGLNDDDIIPLESMSSEKGISTGEYTDVMTKMGVTGLGIVWNTTDEIEKAHDAPMHFSNLPVRGIEEVLHSVSKFKLEKYGVKVNTTNWGYAVPSEVIEGVGLNEKKPVLLENKDKVYKIIKELSEKHNVLAFAIKSDDGKEYTICVDTRQGKFKQR